MKDKFLRFMYGRYGADALFKFTSYLALALLLLSMFLRKWIGEVGTAIAVALLVYSYFRVFSKNIAARRRENDAFLRYKRHFTDWLRLRRDMWQQRKDYKFFKCPSCKAVMRVPVGKGKIRVLCKKCGAAFEKRT